MEIKKIKGIYYLFICIGILLFSTITYLFYSINTKSSKMLNHRTLIIKDLSYIKYHIAETHLWLMEYSAGDNTEKQKVFQNLILIETKIKHLIHEEKLKRMTSTSKHRNNTEIKKRLMNIEKEFYILKNLVMEQLLKKYIAGSEFDITFDKQYSKFLIKISSLEQYLDITFEKVIKSFSNMKDNVYILIFILAFSSLLISYIVMRREISKIKKIIEKEEELKKQSQTKIEAISSTISNIAHQWRQPLSAVTTSVSGLKLQMSLNNKIDHDQLLKSINFVLDKSQYMSNIISDFKAFYSNESMICHKEFNVKLLIKSTIDSLNTKLKEEKINIIFDGENFLLTNSEVQLKQVFLNILNNSIEALKDKEEKYIFISAKTQKEKKLIITFKDSAKGIDEDIINQIYLPYFTTKHQSQGTGLGLYFVYEVITKYFKGDIDSKNALFSYRDKKLKGLETTIILPQN